ncbi:ectoine/hydroxyectoine ABC transporter substrate-binding protein EhuB [Salsipaludibacter albus]|uniref:ectoine/hydroxyectoine ABC transporter substrate-binding protein EhuB n=1 Tax=Salsipaludibacter albus TaxID=2849650 RepID=UPI001EE3E9FB|nr:ectoine/hydroxyectoine ABC transporter substrate-binding protein EhuB [Salsipaludibacter albus]MBY5164232.1 ectoine/hydroxyectoine ABC transporter substrate-binding protein EhuB [Salsipaludibacter albus]
MRGHRTKWMRGAAVLFSVALLASACGSDDGGDGDDATEAGGDASATDAGDSGDSGGGGDLLAELQESGTITVGLANEVPYGYQEDDGTVTGEAPEVAKLVLAEMGIEEMDAQVVEFGSLISGLQAGQFDMIAAGMYINAERAEQILFSDPDYCIGESLAVPEGNPLGLSDFESVVETPEATIAILSGAVEEGYAETAGVPDNQIELYTDVNAQYDDLANGRVDAVTGTSLTIKTQVDSRDGLEMTESFFPLDENGEEILGCGGFGFRNDNQEFRDAFNEQLNALQEEGALIDTITGFGFAPEDVERAQDLTVADLTGE